ncbi:MAG TPA: PEP-CTERM sorting domain-containing protein [Candidatus Baltobacteraceae bacterium]|nr:PEP-CTERM sorting domain-containing protein [Candidatus Baltobacteraceae bacterium]
MKTISNTIAAAEITLLLLALPLHAATFTLNPSADAFVTTGPTANLSGNNYGGAGALSIAAPGLANGEFQSVMRFDLSGARTSFDTQFGAGQWSIQSITLQLTATSPNNAIFNASAAGQFGISWMQNDSWVEGTGTPAAPATTGITYSSLPSFLSAGDESLGIFSFGGGTSGNNSYSLALTSGFDADATAGNLVSVRLSAADTTVSYLFDSRSFGTTGFRPLLTITAVPEPGVLSLLPAGAVLLLGARCRRNRHG